MAADKEREMDLQDRWKQARKNRRTKPWIDDILNPWAGATRKSVHLVDFTGIATLHKELLSGVAEGMKQIFSFISFAPGGTTP